MVLTHISLSVSDLAGALEKIKQFGGAVVDGTVAETMAMIRPPAGSAGVAFRPVVDRGAVSGIAASSPIFTFPM